MIYQCREVAPKFAIDWFEQEANSPGEAANTYHSNNFPMGLSYIQEDDNGRTFIYFATIEVRDHGIFTSRMYSYGISRSGGVKMPRKTLSDIAKALDYKDDPNTLIEENWDYEESMEEARVRSLIK
jgi:phosphoribulokinase